MQVENSTLPSDAPWARVLEKFHRDGGLDYEGLKNAPEDLEQYLATLGEAKPDDASRAERTAFYVNAFNAVVAKFVIDRYPAMKSVKDVDGFFNRERFPVAGMELTLDEIEKKARDEGDPRVHFAVVCASHSCPALRFEPFRADSLSEQLEEQTRLFLADTEKGLRFDRDRDDLWLSSIFKWYAGDFTGGSTMVAFFARAKVLEWVVPHLPAELAGVLREAEPSVKYLDYDWSLNDR